MPKKLLAEFPNGPAFAGWGMPAAQAWAFASEQGKGAVVYAPDAMFRVHPDLATDLARRSAAIQGG